MSDKERADFENWMADKHPGYNIKDRKADGRYWSSHTHIMWVAYQAGRAALDAPAPSAQELSDERIEAVWVEHGLDDCDPIGFARAILAAAKALGGGEHG